jgi:hypothetical protein
MSIPLFQYMQSLAALKHPIVDAKETNGIRLNSDEMRMALIASGTGLLVVLKSSRRDLFDGLASAPKMEVW